MTYQLPVFYDSVNLVVRTMDSSAQIPPAQVPVSSHSGNVIEVLSDGIYVGSPIALPSVVYINAATGVNQSGGGTLSAPYQTIDYAIAQLVSESTNSQLSTSVIIALHAGQTFPMTADVNLYGGTITFTFYGDTNYGSYTNAPVSGTNTNPWFLSNLARPTITPQVSDVNGYWHLAGINVYSGNVCLQGVTIQLPVAPTSPAISLYANAADFVRSMNYLLTGYLLLTGTIVNVQDTNAFWGILGLNAESTFTLIQYGSQFTVNNTLLESANSPTTAQLAARNYFIKFYPDYAGNNQQQGVLYNTSSTATNASAQLTVLWADTEAFTITGSYMNLASFPVAYDLAYGLRNYLYGATYDSLNRPINVNSSREI